jgi:sugar (pentulose or hexulose) kinase
VTLHPSACLIGLDLGTSAIKGVLTDARGTVLAEAGADSRFIHPREGWVEVEPEPHYRNVCRVIRELAAAAPGEVVGLAMAAASGNTLLTDAAAAPLTSIIHWMDQRAEQSPPRALAGLDARQVAQVVGWPCITIFPLGHLAWLRENRADVYAAAGHCGMDTDWILYRLTGRWLMDHSTATTFHLQDQLSGAYHEPFLERLAIPREKLSALAGSGVAAGPLTAQAQRDTGLSPRATVVTGCFDHPAAARAMGVLEPGQLMLSCGTSWVGFAPCADRARILEAELLCDPFLSAGGGPWGGMFSVPQIGRAIDWYVENVVAPGEPDRLRVFNELAAEAAPGAGGLEIDLRLPPKALPGADRRQVSRAVMEGAARLLNERILAVRKYGLRYERAVLVGGPARSPVWPPIVAEITGLEVAAGSRSAGAQGAAILAGIGTGLYRDERAAHPVDSAHDGAGNGDHPPHAGPGRTARGAGAGLARAAGAALAVPEALQPQCFIRPIGPLGPICPSPPTGETPPWKPRTRPQPGSPSPSEWA